MVLEAEKALAVERAKDLKAQSEIEENEAVKEALNTEIAYMENNIAEREKTLEELRKTTKDAQDVIDRVNDWKKLEEEARGEK